MGINLGAFNTAIYVKIVWCSFNYFEQCKYNLLCKTGSGSKRKTYVEAMSCSSVVRHLTRWYAFLLLLFQRHASTS